MTYTAAQLQQVLDDHMQEGLYLEFKRGAALVPSNGARQELVKDCTGFANAGGGTILYGIAEEDVEGVPVAASLSPLVQMDRLRLCDRRPMSPIRGRRRHRSLAPGPHGQL